MKKVIIGVVLVVVAGFGWWTISPFFIDKKVSEQAPIQNTKVVSTWTFEGFDSIHYGSGNVSVIKVGEKQIIRMEENFNVANGPDLYVGLGKGGQYQKGTEIGKLKGNIGSQNYELSEHLDLENYDEVWIWCKAFSVGFAKAKLTPSI